MPTPSHLIAVPAQGIKHAQVIQGRPNEICVSFDDPLAGLRFAHAVRKGIAPAASQYHHVILNEEIGDKSFVQHFVLATTGEADPQACAQYMAATLYDDDEDAPVPTPDEGGCYLLDNGSSRVSVLTLKTLSEIDGQAMARHLPVCRSEDMPMNEAQRAAVAVPRG